MAIKVRKPVADPRQLIEQLKTSFEGAVSDNGGDMSGPTVVLMEFALAAWGKCFPGEMAEDAMMQHMGSRSTYEEFQNDVDSIVARMQSATSVDA